MKERRLIGAGSNKKVQPKQLDVLIGGGHFLLLRTSQHIKQAHYKNA
jgi:hypothetical protein